MSNNQDTENDDLTQGHDDLLGAGVSSDELLGGGVDDIPLGDLMSQPSSDTDGDDSDFNDGLDFNLDDDDPANDDFGLNTDTQGDFPDDGDDEDDDLDDEPDELETSASSEPKKENKLKTYGILAGVAVVLAGVLGGGYVLTKPNPSTSQRAMKQDMPPAFDPQPAQQQAAPSQPTPPAQPIQSIEQPSYEPQLDLQSEQRIEPRTLDQVPTVAEPVQEVTPTVDLSQLVELGEKTDFLASALTDVKRQSDAYAPRIDEIEAKLATLNDRLQELMDRLDAVSQDLGPIKTKFDEDKAKAEEAEKKAQERRQRASNKKPAAKPATKSQTATPKAAPAKPAPASVAGYSVVATYPSTTSAGMQPEKAWVTNGQRLLQVMVGSKVGSATVTRIEGTTVFTTQGEIRSPR